MTRVAILLLRFYRAWISPALPATCIYSPSCSAYALEAYDRHGFWRGTWMTARRLARCAPWRTGGFDPVPPEPCGRRPRTQE